MEANDCRGSAGGEGGAAGILAKRDWFIFECMLQLVLLWQPFVIDLFGLRAWDLRSVPGEPGNFLSPATLIHLASGPGEASGRLAAAA